MITGRKPKSASIHYLTARDGGIRTAGGRLINDAEPKPEGEVVRPVWVKGRASKMWDKYAGDLIKNELLTAWDVETFGTWCVLQAEFQKSPNDFPASKLSHMRQHAELFGLAGGSSRARLKVNVKKESETPGKQFYS